jgi:hypothetical protein
VKSLEEENVAKLMINEASMASQWRKWRNPVINQ